MKRFVLAILVILLLCHNVGASQDKSDATNSANPPPTVSVEQKIHADESPKPHQENASVKIETAIGDQNPPIIEGFGKLVKPAYIALFFSFIATVIAFFSLRSSNEAVDVTREIGEKQSCAYMAVESVRFGFSESHAICQIVLENVGNSPCVSGKITTQVKSEDTMIVPWEDGATQREFFSEEKSKSFGIVQTNSKISEHVTWFGGHYKSPDKWFDLCCSDIGTDSRVLVTVEWVDVFGKKHVSKFDAHKHHDFTIDWDKPDIFSEALAVNHEQTYERDK